MRDVLPEATEALGALTGGLLATFGGHGYRQVTTPAFEYAEVLERGMSSIDRAEQLRFFEPGTGELALLRPDMTPQIARIVATRLAHLPAPWRLAYAGTVLRQRKGRARLGRQATQAGIELIGVAGVAADREVITLAAAAVQAAGLEEFVLELSQVKLGQGALEQVPAPLRGRASEALARKDTALLEAVLSEGRVPQAVRRRLLRLTELYGGLNTLKLAKRQLRDESSRAALADLERVVDALGDAGLGDHLAVDLGELRGHGYYTGVSFNILADGPGEPLGGGGRYDDLLGRYGHPAPATGFALDVGHLQWARSRAGHAAAVSRPPRWVVSSDASTATALRAQGVQVAEVDGPLTAALDFARAWGYDGAVAKGRWTRLDGSAHTGAVNEDALAFVRGERA
ncbi:MAG: ATP phosphoribosyltransferase regulatory subunit [Sandaracinus sp.]|nr:ATP phosphoribosyltransferase regulatory subunit [Sandaracinus sp.]MAQ16704.1 ATP phosphoribosyltransferase regulatory subunit [Sandaracinus sp.]|tara:strand:+ start:934 stop:2133 length:1200 start_codon:yes stop_codon:yes gene_type:complete